MTDPPISRTPFLLTTAPGQQRIRIDRFLQQALPSISRQKVTDLIETGLVLVEGKIPKKSYKIGPDEHIEIYFRDQPPSDIRPEDLRLDIIYEDGDLLVVNKPQGMVTHPAHGHFSGTLVNGLMHHLGLEDAGATIRPGIVHRLDKGTSGLLVVAKNEVVHRRLTEQFSARTVRRMYVALVWGRFQTTDGIVDAPLARHPGDRKRIAVVRHGGKTAITTFHVEETFKETTFLTLRLKTGRTHQIRAHMEFQGHPLFGDATYGGRHKRLAVMSGSRRKFYAELLEDIDDAALHAQTLGFVHPSTGQELEYSVPPPSNFTKIVNLLREDAYKNLDNI